MYTLSEWYIPLINSAAYISNLEGIQTFTLHRLWLLNISDLKCQWSCKASSSFHKHLEKAGCFFQDLASLLHSAPTSTFKPPSLWELPAFFPYK